VYNGTMSEREDIVFNSTALRICTFAQHILHAYYVDTFCEALDINSVQMISAVGRVTNIKITISHEVTNCIFDRSNAHKTYHLLH
jgi:hypothetical protein